MDKDNNSNKSADKKSSASGNSTPGQADSNPLLDAAFGKFFSLYFLKIVCKMKTVNVIDLL